jgi:hypothetical protein
VDTPDASIEPTLEELAYYEALARRRLQIGRKMPEDPAIAEALLWAVDAQVGLIRLIRSVQRYQGRVVPSGPDDRPPMFGKYGRYWPYPCD